MKTKSKIDTRLAIAAYLEEKGIKPTWLAQKIEVSPTHLHFILKAERDLTEDNLQKINKALDKSF